MGNSQKSKRGQSFLKKTKSAQANCLACMPNYESYEGSNLDNNELNIFKTFCQPKGKISPKSIAYLTKDEINFFKASAGRNISAIRYYLKKAVNVNTFDEDRTSPLHVAARHASIQVVEELLNWGALVDITDSDGWTPLHVASYFQRPVVCHLLLKKGANPSIPNKDNAKPMDLARDPKLREIFEVYFSKLKDGTTSSRKDKLSQGGLSSRTHRIETENDPKVETTYENKATNKLLSQYNSEFIGQKYLSCDSLGNVEEPARVPNLIMPKQHKYYLYFKNLKVKTGTISENDKNATNSNFNALLSAGTINSLSFSNDDPDEVKQNYLENQSEMSSVMFCDDSQIGDYEESGKNLALNFQINKTSKFKHPPTKLAAINNSAKPKMLNEFLHIKQNIPFKLKNVYTSALNVKKGLKFQVNSSQITAGQKGSFEKAQLPPKSNFKPTNVDFWASRNIAHYNKNPLTSNKPSKQQISYTPDSSRSILFVDNKVISLKDFVKETISLNLTIEDIGKKEKNKRNWIDHNLPLETNFQKMVDIGIEMFNMKAISGISYSIFIKYIKATPPAIAKFIHTQRNFNEKPKNLGNSVPIKRDRTQITSFLTNLNIKEILDILSFYTESFIFRDMSFVSALKFFLNNFIIDNDPEKIDILLYAFSRKYFKELKKIKVSSDNIREKTQDEDYIRKIFQNFDAVHMLAFATIMLDIEIHHVKRKDLENVIKEFNINVKGLNDGENFPKEFIDSIVENVLAQNLVVLNQNEEKKQNEKKSLRALIIQQADLCLVVKKKKKNQKDFAILQVAMIENLGFIFRNSNDDAPLAVFVLENCNVKVKGVSFLLAANEKKSNKLIIYGKFNECENGTITVKYKETIEFILIESCDAKKIVKYVEKMNDEKSVIH